MCCGRYAAAAVFATHLQALNILLCLYRQVLGMELPWMQQIGHPAERKRIPVVLTVREVQSVLSLMTGIEGLLAALLYFSGLRLRESLVLRFKGPSRSAMRAR